MTTPNSNEREAIDLTMEETVTSSSSSSSSSRTAFVESRRGNDDGSKDDKQTSSQIYGSVCLGNSQHTASDSIRKESLGDSSGDGELQARLQTDEHALVKGTENVFFNGPVEDLVPDWPLDEHLPDKAADEDDNLDQIRRYDESSNRQNTEWTNKSYPSLEKQPSFALANDRTEVALSRIESLSVDLLSIILSHLSLLEVSDVLYPRHCTGFVGRTSCGGANL